MNEASAIKPLSPGLWYEYQMVCVYLCPNGGTRREIARFVDCNHRLMISVTIPIRRNGKLAQVMFCFFSEPKRVFSKEIPVTFVSLQSVSA